LFDDIRYFFYLTNDRTSAAEAIVPAAGWLVISHRSPPDPWGWGGPGAMRAAMVDANGEPADKASLKENSPQDRLPNWLDVGKAKTPGATWPFGPSASAFDGRQSVAVWQRHHLAGEKKTNFENCDLIAARVEGTKSLDPAGVPVAASELEESHPAIAGDGAGACLVVYRRHASETQSAVMARLLRTQ
jgi:hypothetical protein